MKTIRECLMTVLFSVSIAHGILAQTETLSAANVYAWKSFPDQSKFQVLGLAWFQDNAPQLWRMPASKMEMLPKGVQNRSKCPSGGRILLKSTTSRLALRIESSDKIDAGAFETFVNGQTCTTSFVVKSTNKTELVLFENLDHQEKEIVIYLPHVREVRVVAIGVDQDAKFSPPEHQFAQSAPIVFYGSSVCQGSGAEHSGHTYVALLARALNLDFVNLGFGGAGKAEGEVVELVNSLPACCYVFDLGKSYGDQDATAYRVMLEEIRKNHPNTPLIAMTPITSAKELKEPSYAERSLHTRTVMREAVRERIEKGDKHLYLVEGEDLLGFGEHSALSKDGVHPSDRGYEIIASKLTPIIQRVIQR